MGLVDNSFLEQLIDKETKEQETDVEKFEKQAKKDFRYLCNSKNIMCKDMNEFITLEKSRSIGLVYVVGAEKKDGMAFVPQDKVDLQKQDLYIGVVIYDEGKVCGVYMFAMADFARPMGLFSTFKNLKKTNQYGINITKPEKIANNQFGTVMNEYI